MSWEIVTPEAAKGRKRCRKQKDGMYKCPRIGGGGSGGGGSSSSGSMKFQRVQTPKGDWAEKLVKNLPKPALPSKRAITDYGRAMLDTGKDLLKASPRSWIEATKKEIRQNMAVQWGMSQAAFQMSGPLIEYLNPTDPTLMNAAGIPGYGKTPIPTGLAEGGKMTQLPKMPTMKLNLGQKLQASILSGGKQAARLRPNYASVPDLTLGLGEAAATGLGETTDAAILATKEGGTALVAAAKEGGAALVEFGKKIIAGTVITGGLGVGAYFGGKKLKARLEKTAVGLKLGASKSTKEKPNEYRILLDVRKEVEHLKAGKRSISDTYNTRVYLDKYLKPNFERLQKDSSRGIGPMKALIQGYMDEIEQHLKSEANSAEKTKKELEILTKELATAQEALDKNEPNVDLSGLLPLKQ